MCGLEDRSTLELHGELSLALIKFSGFFPLHPDGDDPLVRHTHRHIDADNVVHLDPHRCGGYHQSGQCTSIDYSMRESHSENGAT